MQKPLNKRARKRLRQQRESTEAAERFRFGLLAAAVLRRGDAFEDIGFTVADVEVIPHFDGRPEDMFAWLIFSNREEAEAAKLASAQLEVRARALLAEGGFPADALPSFGLGYTSEPEIEQGGGGFSFFR
jgi:hypothetical protein